MITVEVEDAAVAAALARLTGQLSDLTPVMQEIGEMLVASTQDRMARGEQPDGAAFAPRSKTTLDRYAKLGIKFGPPLNVSGMLRGGIFAQPSADRVEVGSPAIQSAVMHFGAPQGAFGLAPWGDIPARPFLGLSATDRAGIGEIVEEWLERAAGGAPL